MTAPPDQPPREESYTVLPRLYDRFVALRKSDYSIWLNHVDGLASEHHMGRRVLSLAAGTGECEIELARRGFEVTCTDLSTAMLATAQEKLAQGKDPPAGMRFLQMDMRDIPAGEPYDLVLCHYYALNYLVTIEDVRRCFTSVRQALRSGGVFTFDTMHNEHFSSRGGQRAQRFIETDDVTSLQQTDYGEDGTIHAELTLFFREGDVYHKAKETHHQRIYHLAELRAALRAAGFTDIHAYRYGTRESPLEHDKRVSFVCV